MLKLYVLIRDDISPAQQAVQAGHAVAQFGLEHPKEFKTWQESSNILIYLSVGDLHRWKTVLEDGKFTCSPFFEPDLITDWSGPSGLLTTIAVAPDWICQYVLFKDLPLALKPSHKRWWQR